MPKLLHEIGGRAFLGAFKVKKPITIIIGSELEILNPLSFGNHYNNIPKTGNTIIIGSAEERSYLDLSKCPDQGNVSNEPMRIKDSRFTTIEFYSGIYTSPDQEVYYLNNKYYTVRGCLDFAETAL